MLERYEGEGASAVRWSLGEVRVSRLATIYKKVRFLTHENIGSGPISLPEQDLHTVAAWTAFRPDAVSELSRGELTAALTGLAAVMHSAASMLCMCDPRDLGSLAEIRGGAPPAPLRGVPAMTAREPVDEPLESVAGWRPSPAPATGDEEAGWPTVYLHDSVAGGVGFAERCHQARADLVRIALDLVNRCSCERGCPSCVGPPPARVDGRASTRRLLELVGQGNRSISCLSAPKTWRR